MDLAGPDSEEEDVGTQHQKSHLEPKLDDDLRARNARALEFVRKWLADDSGYDEAVFPVSAPHMFDTVRLPRPSLGASATRLRADLMRCR
jgi:hypothetical protein